MTSSCSLMNVKIKLWHTDMIQWQIRICMIKLSPLRFSIKEFRLVVANKPPSYDEKFAGPIVIQRSLDIVASKTRIVTLSECCMAHDILRFPKVNPILVIMLNGRFNTFYVNTRIHHSHKLEQNGPSLRFAGEKVCPVHLNIMYTVRASFGFLWPGIHRCYTGILQCYPDSKVHGAKMGPIWGRQDPDGPHIGPMNFAV